MLLKRVEFLQNARKSRLLMCIINFFIFFYADEKCTEYVNCYNYAQWRCVDCNDLYCNSCNTKVHNAARAIRKHVRIPLGCLDVKDFRLNCSEHHSVLADYYCETCKLFICWKCIAEHKDHQCKSIVDQVRRGQRFKNHVVIFVKFQNKNEIPILQEKLQDAENMLKRVQCEKQVSNYNIKIYLFFKYKISTSIIKNYI